MISSTPVGRSAFVTTLLFLLLSSFLGRAATIPATEDSFADHEKFTVTVTANNATALPVDGKRYALVFFNLSDLPANAEIRDARLRLFLSNVVRPGNGLSLHTVSTPWSETAAGEAPAYHPEPCATIPNTDFRRKRFISVNVTDTVRAWQANPSSNEGFAIVAIPNEVAMQVASVVLSSKAGSGSGYPAELDVELNPIAPPPAPNLQAIANLPSAANKLLYATGPGSWGLSTFTPFARSLLAAGNPQELRDGLGKLVDGRAIVPEANVTDNSRITITEQNLGTVTIPQALAVGARTVGANFTIVSADSTDTSDVAWTLIEP